MPQILEFGAGGTEGLLQDPTTYLVWFDGTNYRADSMIGTANYTENDPGKAVQDALTGMAGVGGKIVIKGNLTFGTGVLINDTTSGGSGLSNRLIIESTGTITNNVGSGNYLFQIGDTTHKIFEIDFKLNYVLNKNGAYVFKLVNCAECRFKVLTANGDGTGEYARFDGLNTNSMTANDCIFEYVTLVGFANIFHFVAGSQGIKQQAEGTGLYGGALFAKSSGSLVQNGVLIDNGCDAGLGQIFGTIDMLAGATGSNDYTNNGAMVNAPSTGWLIAAKFIRLNTMKLGIGDIVIHPTSDGMLWAYNDGTTAFGFITADVTTNVPGIVIGDGGGGNILAVQDLGSSKVVLHSQYNLGFKEKVAYVNNIATSGLGVPSVFGLDNRSGLTAVDGAPITLYAVPTGAGQLFRITADIFATAFTSGTATYTITWTENAVTRTLVVTATALNTLGTGTDLINADASTNITAQLTGVFTATVKVAGLVEQIA